MKFNDIDLNLLEGYVEMCEDDGWHTIRSERAGWCYRLSEKTGNWITAIAICQFNNSVPLDHQLNMTEHEATELGFNNIKLEEYFISKIVKRNYNFKSHYIGATGSP